MSSLRKHIGARIKQARQKTKLSQEELAARIDKSRETISNLERGEGLSGLDILERIADELGVDVEFLVADFAGDRQLTRSRRELEHKVSAQLRDVSDRDLRLLASLVASMQDSND